MCLTSYQDHLIHAAKRNGFKPSQIYYFLSGPCMYCELQQSGCRVNTEVMKVNAFSTQ